MPLTARLPLLPENAVEIGSSLAILHDEERVVLFNAAGPIFSCRRDDRTGLRLAGVTVVEQGLAGPGAVARALGVHRTTLFRDAQRYAENGVAGLVEKRRGPKGPHALTPAVRRRAQTMLDAGKSIRATAAAVELSERGLRHAIRRGLLTGPARPSPVPTEPPTAVPAEGSENLVGPRTRAAQDQACEGGVAVKRTEERALARVGGIAEAAPVFERAEAVPGAGVLLALPALLEEGLLEVGEAVYGKLRDGFFGLRSVLLTFAFMALLRIRTPEQLTAWAPGELGLLLGLDRAPEVKTLRRKLRELGAFRRAHEWLRRLTERWAHARPRELAVLYVDGHVRPYHGRTRVLPKQHVQQRGRPMPGTKDFHVNDRRAAPLFFVTAEATESLLETLDATLLPEVRRLVGPRRRVTIVFDREGWSPKRFARWKDEGFDVLTYRKGKQPAWPTKAFKKVAGQVGGQRVRYRLAERRVKLSNGLRVREVRRLTDDGHQTAVITTNEKLSRLAVAQRMFSRWRQENFFRYMRHEFALDHLCTYDVEPADPARLVPHPEYKKLQAELQATRRARRTLLERYENLPPGKTTRVGNERLDAKQLRQRIRHHQADIDRLEARRSTMPRKAAIGEVLAAEPVVQLERERKVLVDTLKLTAYRAETALSRQVEPIFARHQDEARKFLKTIFQAPADLVPNPRAGRLTVRFHGLTSPRTTRALRALCALVNESAPVYPGTKLRLHFEAP